MSRVAAAISCTADDLKELERLSKSRTDEARMVDRAKVILGCLAGRRNDEVAAELGIQAATVGSGANASPARGWRGCVIERAQANRRSIRLRNCASAFLSN